MVSFVDVGKIRGIRIKFRHIVISQKFLIGILQHYFDRTQQSWLQCLCEIVDLWTVTPWTHWMCEHCVRVALQLGFHFGVHRNRSEQLHWAVRLIRKSCVATAVHRLEIRSLASFYCTNARFSAKRTQINKMYTVILTYTIMALQWKCLCLLYGKTTDNAFKMSNTKWRGTALYVCLITLLNLFFNYLL